MRILLIEDESKVARALESGLQEQGYDVVFTMTGEEGFYYLNSEEFDLVLLDLMLPGKDGLEILRTVRSQGIKTPVIVLTARDTVDDRVQGLDSGADDYLVKPFAFAELLARIRALSRRGRLEQEVKFQIGDLEMDIAKRSVSRAGEPLHLTTREFDLLGCLLRHMRNVVSRETLAREVWRLTSRANSMDNVIDVHIARLRKKIDTDDQLKLIHTVRGVGFIVSEDEL